MNRPKKKSDYIGTMRKMGVGQVLTISGKYGRANTFSVSATRLKQKEGKVYRVLRKEQEVVIIRRR